MPDLRPDWTKKLNRNDWITILVNLIPVGGVWFLGWSATEAFIVYALETLIIGILTVIKLLAAAVIKKKDTWNNQGNSQQVSGLFIIIFFILHYGIFALCQTTMFAGVAGINPPGKGQFYFFFHWWEFINRDIGYMLIVFVLSYLIRDMIPFLFRKDYNTIPMMILMFQPYGRILTQQFTVIAGSMFLSFNLGKIFILVFALAKIFVEVFLNFESILGKSMQGLKEGSGKQ